MRLDGKLLAYHTDVTVFRNVGSIRIYKKSKKIIVNGKGKPCVHGFSLLSWLLNKPGKSVTYAFNDQPILLRELEIILAMGPISSPIYLLLSTSLKVKSR